MDLPKTELTPDDPDKLPPARKRRAERQLTPVSSITNDADLDQITRSVSPSFDTFLFSVISAIIISFGIIVDSPAIMVLGVLFAPMLSPIVGLSLGTVTGSIKFFIRSFASLLIIGLIVLIISTLGGYLADILGKEEFIQVYYHSQLSWRDILVLSIGIIMTTLSTVNSKQRTAVVGAALSFEIFLPLSIAGFGLGSGIPNLWPDGLVVFAVHLSLASLLGAITLVIIGFRPLTLFGFTVGGVISLVLIVFFIGLSGVGAAFWGQIALPTGIPTSTSTLTQTLPPSSTPTITLTPVPPTATLSPTTTPTITPSPSGTPIPSPTPVYAIVNAGEEYGGAFIRTAPEIYNPETIITSILNGTLVEILSEKPEIADDLEWLRVRIPDGTEGWMLQSVLLAATPAPNW
jgi:uncharacterized membrane protein